MRQPIDIEIGSPSIEIGVTRDVSRTFGAQFSDIRRKRSLASRRSHVQPYYTCSSRMMLAVHERPSRARMCTSAHRILRTHIGRTRPMRPCRVEGQKATEDRGRPRHAPSVRRAPRRRQHRRRRAPAVDDGRRRREGGGASPSIPFIHNARACVRA